MAQNDNIILYNIAETFGNFYVYSLCKSDSVPFYIGVGQWDRKTSRERYEDHIMESFNPTDKTNLHKTRTIQKIINAGNKILVNILFQFNSIDEAFSKEIGLIAKYGRCVNNTGILTNLTLGGDGVTGYDRSGERNPMFGKTMSVKACQKIRLARLGVPQSELTKTKMSLTHTIRLAKMTDKERAFRNSLPKKLTEADVKYIRSVNINNREEKQNIADSFNVSESTINDVRTRRSYKWVE